MPGVRLAKDVPTRYTRGMNALIGNMWERFSTPVDLVESQPLSLASVFGPCEA